MHIPDGFLDAPTSLGTGVLAVGAVGLALRQARKELGETGPVLAGLVACFVFAVQMVNFPVGAGTSGHLLGGALAATLVGPWTGVLVMTTVLLVQGLVFADGGLTALGANVTDMGIVGVLVGYLVVRGVLAVLPRRPGSVVPAAAVGGLLSVPAAALAFTAMYAVGGTAPIPLGRLAAAMLGWHAIIGVGEAVITAAVVAAVVASRPDLVHAARHLVPDLELVDAEGRRTVVRADAPVARRSTRLTPRFAGGLLAASLVVGGGLSLLASSHPDGLEYVGETLGFGSTATDSAAASSPLAGYSLRWLGDGTWGSVVAGILGVLLTLLVGVLLSSMAGRRREGLEGSQTSAGAEGCTEETLVGSEQSERR
ncbi:energy-coupling factor ABC transporter permease [Arsenicicoccus sp. oral taxon 190]|uniref:energy-coupling factor ABC transporter permease n=1 Tax=Arsenicicoccus sp. oral taxon 190 TaxID=1658671 RepID=UPI00067A32BB|nr:energy-coupling factor ABC transporter permease [Arsenicicoccus sp. oral taxon 190]AKT50503.1 cobalt ABC transporter permease [Arsenicicoccus sp. oral taxon 190]